MAEEWAKMRIVRGLFSDYTGKGLNPADTAKGFRIRPEGRLLEDNRDRDMVHMDWIRKGRIDG